MKLQEEWDSVIAILNGKLSEFSKKIIPVMPDNIYKVEVSGALNEGYGLKPYYIYPFNTWFRGKRPTKIELQTLKDSVNSFVEFSEEKFSLVYSYKWGEGYKATTGISLKDFLAMKPPYFIDKPKAEEYAQMIREKNRKDKEFDELHKKTPSYDYKANGYKDLGWQNSWKHVYFDEDGKQTTGDISKGEKPKRTFGYTKEDYPEYGTCIELGHRTIEVSHNNRGSHHDVSCPICKILWKYDSSD